MLVLVFIHLLSFSLWLYMNDEGQVGLWDNNDHKLSGQSLKECRPELINSITTKWKKNQYRDHIFSSCLKYLFFAQGN